MRNRSVFVVAAFGHGNQHTDVHADVHAITPTAGAQIVRSRLYDLPTRQRRVIADHIAQASRLVLDGRTDPSYLATGLSTSLANVAANVLAAIDRNTQLPASPYPW